MTASTTELGVYILGATALCILTAVGISMADKAVVVCAVLASGAAYLSQAFAVWAQGDMDSAWAMVGNGLLMLAAIGAWCVGVAFLAL